MGARRRRRIGQLILLGVALTYFLLYGFTVWVARSLLPPGTNTIVYGLPLLLSYAVLSFALMRRFGLKPRMFGVTLRRAGRYFHQSCALSVFILLILLAGKAALIDLEIIDGPLLSFRGLKGLSLSEGTALVLGYLVGTPLQELVARGVLQSAVLHLSTGKLRGVRAVLMANALFAMNHVHLGWTMVSVSFALGLVWGLIALGQRSIVGAAFSHALVGGVGMYVLR